MADADPEAQRQIEELRALFRPQLADRVREIEAAWAAVQGGDAAAGGGSGDGDSGEPPLRRFHRLTHSLAGTAGTFGYPEVGSAARALERHLRELLPAERREPGAPPAPADSTEVVPLLVALARAVAAA